MVFEVNDLEVRYGRKIAVEGIRLSLKEGECLGLLGANGAGKTSTVKALLGMLSPNKGEVKVWGRKAGDPKGLMRLGFAPEDAVPPEYLTAEEYLHFLGSLRKKKKAERNVAVAELLTWFDLAPKKKIRDYSKGMKRRLVLSQAMLFEPPLLILDEPLNGLDPLVIMKLRDRLDQYRKKGGAILYSSHILAEVEKTCTSVAILSQGKLVYAAGIEELKKEFPSVEAAFAAKAGGTV